MGHWPIDLGVKELHQLRTEEFDATLNNFSPLNYCESEACVVTSGDPSRDIGIDFPDLGEHQLEILQSQVHIGSFAKFEPRCIESVPLAVRAGSNGVGLSDHICNAGWMVAPDSSGLEHWTANIAEIREFDRDS